MATIPQESPPPFEASHTIDLISVDDSKIANVSLYSGRAEITRIYKFPVKTGQNQVSISGLPNVLDPESLRVEGRGAATIHDVALSDIPEPVVASMSPDLEDLLSKQEWNQKALERAKKSLASLEAYLSTLNVQHINVTELGQVMDSYDIAGEKLDKKVTELEKTLKGIEADIKVERKKLTGPTRDARLRKRATIGVFANSEGEVEIVLIYGVRQANWTAGYDIRVDMEAKDKPVTLIYKAGITQNTGEDWDDVPLTLETASPTFGVDIPTLSPWSLSVYRPVIMKKSKRNLGLAPRGMASQYASNTYGSLSMAVHERDSEIDTPGIHDSTGIEHRELAVSSKGNISATFRVPGIITIPSDNASHNVTVVQLKLDASMSWVTVPKVDARTHLKAKIKNASEYTLLQGTASVYVDGSFISRSDVPLVSPQESFDCPLGLDPSIRITYHPRSKKVSHSGFYTKSSVHVFTQRITVFNTKAHAVNDVKVVDQVPVSESSQITVKLVSPSLSVPEASGTGGEVQAPQAVKVGEGVHAQWEGADEQGIDMEHLGRDGKFHWVCAVPSQGKINLVLSWEVSAPLHTDIVGL
ncbi:hypothetical protein BDZ94DRAFT_1320028 [Collybia nuda]|uniref:Protein F37C4.5 n=1 Tax=Collybia nuda TaxID=64659 RepID=A0A9P6CMH7_9AGAR|nr:hypothetical protein BDZ94DRAFT_1320028 [Collybia nuda]